MLDEHYLSIDLTRFMCSSCEVGQEECCVRKVEAVALMLKSNRKRKVQRKKRLSYDKHHVDCARKASKDAASQDASAKAKKFGVLNDSTNYQKVVMKCRADTPSKSKKNYKMCG
jgi:hypothetical protein